MVILKSGRREQGEATRLEEQRADDPYPRESHIILSYLQSRAAYDGILGVWRLRACVKQIPHFTAFFLLTYSCWRLLTSHRRCCDNNTQRRIWVLRTYRSSEVFYSYDTFSPSMYYWCHNLNRSKSQCDVDHRSYNRATIAQGFTYYREEVYLKKQGGFFCGLWTQREVVKLRC